MVMFDGAELGKATDEHPENVEAALTVPEKAMFSRSAEIAYAGVVYYLVLFGDDRQALW